MTEDEWLASAAAERMVVALALGHRKLRLLGVACCRRVWPLLNDPRCRRAVEVAERYADGVATEAEMQEADAGAAAAFRERQRECDEAEREWDRAPAVLAAAAAWSACEPSQTSGFSLGQVIAGVAAQAGAAATSPRDESVAQADLARDIFGNPFRPVSFRPEWLTDTAVQLARQMYESRDFGAMPILADALQDAGCDSEDILFHCRGEGPHVRGCWVVDLVLGKE